MTKITRQAERLLALAMINGIDSNDGPAFFQVRPVTDVLTYDTWIADDGWKTVFILANDPELEGGLKLSDIKAGFDDATLHKIYKGRTPTLGLSGMALQEEGLKMAFGTDSLTYTDADVNVESDVDDSVAPNFETIKLTSVVDFTAGRFCTVVTGTVNPERELKQIAIQNVADNTLTFTSPLKRLPIDTAVVKVVKARLTAVGTGVYPNMKARIVRFNPDGTLNVLRFYKVALSADGFPKGGKDAPQTASPKLEILKDWTVVSGALVERYLDCVDVFE